MRPVSFSGQVYVGILAEDNRQMSVSAGPAQTCHLLTI